MASDRNAMFAEERKLKMLEYLEQNKKVTVPQLSEIFKVSNATVRNDLRDLENFGMLTRTHGGAMVKSKAGFESDLGQRKVQNRKEKQKIANLAIDLIEDGDTIILDVGTTTLELAKLLHKKNDITVVTNDLEIALMLEGINSVNTIFMGGIVRKGFHCTVGVAIGDNMLSGLTVDKAFMASNSVSLKKGASTPDLIHAETKKLMISIANNVILLCDHTKFGKNSFVQFAPVNSIDILITDHLNEGDQKKFEELGVKVLL